MVQGQENQTRPRGGKSFSVGLLSTTLWFATGCSLIGVTPYRVAGNSMNPTLFAGDKILTDTVFYEHHPLQDGDVIVFRHHDTVVVKRISGLPGEVMEDRTGQLFRNHQPLRESYVIPESNPDQAASETFPARTIPPGEVFVTGDNRARSLDSRFQEYGLVSVKDVIGKVTYVYASSRDRSGRSL